MLQVRAATLSDDERLTKHLGRPARMPLHSSTQTAHNHKEKKQKLICTAGCQAVAADSTERSLTTHERTKPGLSPIPSN